MCPSAPTHVPLEVFAFGLRSGSGERAMCLHGRTETNTGHRIPTMRADPALMWRLEEFAGDSDKVAPAEIEHFPLWHLALT
jgi:hypothetical protein